MRASLASTLPLAAALLLPACDSATAPPQPVANVVVVAATTELAAGTGMQLIANTINGTGASLSGRTVTWASSVPSVATVSPSGYVDALQSGVTTITATSEGRSGNLVLTVVIGSCVTGSTVQVHGEAIALGQTRTGNIVANPCLLDGYFLARGHAFSLGATTSFQADASGTGHQPELILTNAAGQILDFGFTWSPTASSLRNTLPAGNYILWAGSVNSGASALPYSLSVQSAAGACTSTVANTISLGASETRSIGLASCVLLEGPVVEGFSLTITETTRVHLLATSAAYPPIVVLTTPTLEILGVGYTDDGVTASFSRTLEPGTYRVWAGAIGGATGAVQLSVAELAPCGPVGTITVGATVHGTLTSTSCEYAGRPGALADAWRLTLDAPATLRIDLTSAQLDAYLIVATAAGAMVGFDDDGGDGLNSRLTISLAAGEYDLWAGSFYGFQTGSYALSVVPAVGGMDRDAGVSEPVASKRAATPLPWPSPRRPFAGTGRTESTPTPSGHR